MGPKGRHKCVRRRQREVWLLKKKRQRDNKSRDRSDGVTSQRIRLPRGNERDKGQIVPWSFQEKTRPPNTLGLAFWPPQLQENKLVWF